MWDRGLQIDTNISRLITSVWEDVPISDLRILFLDCTIVWSSPRFLGFLYRRFRRACRAADGWLGAERLPGRLGPSRRRAPT
jgi:hypothetical protein